MPCTWTVGPGPAWLADCVLASAAGAAVSVAPATANPASQDFEVIRGLPSCGEWAQPSGVGSPLHLAMESERRGYTGRNGIAWINSGDGMNKRFSRRRRRGVTGPAQRSGFTECERARHSLSQV